MLDFVSRFLPARESCSRSASQLVSCRSLSRAFWYSASDEITTRHLQPHLDKSFAATIRFFRAGEEQKPSPPICVIFRREQRPIVACVIERFKEPLRGIIAGFQTIVDVRGQ